MYSCNRNFRSVTIILKRPIQENSHTCRENIGKTANNNDKYSLFTLHKLHERYGTIEIDTDSECSNTTSEISTYHLVDSKPAVRKVTWMRREQQK